MFCCYPAAKEEGLYCRYDLNWLEKQRLSISAIHERASSLSLIFAYIIICREEECKIAEGMCRGKRFP